MSNVHQDFKAGLDTKGYEAGMARIENSTKASTARVTREFERVQQSANRGGRGSMRAGQVAMQMQDVAVQMQSGARASTIIAQQGSQILSVFGPQGMLLGGLIAAGAMFWELVRGSKALTAEAKAQKIIEKQGRSTAAAKAGLDQKREDDKAIKIAEARATLSKEEADSVERRLNLEERIAAIRRNSDLSSENKEVFEESARNRARAEERQHTRDRGAESVVNHGDRILNRADQIRGKADSKAEVRREEREQRQAERRAINEELDAADRKERNELQGTGKARTKGLNIGEREKGQAAREEAAKVAKDKKLQAEISQENIDKILNGMENLISK
jgi:hypothetical protein